jgi:ferredoxin
MSQEQPAGTPIFLPNAGLGELVSILRGEGYTVIGPTIQEGVIMLRPIESAEQLARGVQDEQDGGYYRLTPIDRDFFFQYVVGPISPKNYFFPPRQALFAMHIEGGQMLLEPTGPQPPKLAFIGVRPCELAAIRVQDRVFGIDQPQRTFRCESETYYRQTREQSLLIAVNCVRPAGTCFCMSWGTGPDAREGYDLVMTELRDGFVIRAGSERGRDLLARLSGREASSAEMELEELKIEQARKHMGRHLKTAGVKELLDQNIEHPRWDRVAKRCLSCGNCTMVCPTCFCSTVTDSNDLASGRMHRQRQQESCYTLQFSYTTGGPGRNTIRGRYRHWLRHKVCTWWDQFEMSGCVGCGRCITWCPVGIDLTEEIAAIREEHAKTQATEVAP